VSDKPAPVAETTGAQEWRAIQEFTNECRRLWPGAKITLRPNDSFEFVQPARIPRHSQEETMNVKLKPDIAEASPAEDNVAPLPPTAAATEAELDSEESSSDPFDLTNLRLDQSFVESAGVKKLLTTVPVRKPNPQDFVRVHPGPEYRAALAVIELKDDREIYLVPPPIARDLPGEFAMTTIYAAINRQGVLFLWPVRLPPPDGRINEWHRSAAEAAELAMRAWVRVKANISLGAYEMFQAASTIPDPEWPELPFQELLRIGFRDRLIDRLDHAVVKRLRGLA
jgi:hypothetical protein